jgi:hypothetical protein
MLQISSHFNQRSQREIIAFASTKQAHSIASSRSKESDKNTTYIAVCGLNAKNNPCVVDSKGIFLKKKDRMRALCVVKIFFIAEKRKEKFWGIVKIKLFMPLFSRYGIL